MASPPPPEEPAAPMLGRWFARARYKALQATGRFANLADLARAANVHENSVKRFFAGTHGTTTLPIARQLVGQGAPLEKILAVSDAAREDPAAPPAETSPPLDERASP